MDVQVQQRGTKKSAKSGDFADRGSILSTTTTLKRLKQRGYQSLTDVYIELNPSLCEPLSFLKRDERYARWCTQVFIVFLVFVNINI